MSTPTASTSSTAAASSAGPSLTGRLLLWALGALLVVWLSFVVMGYRTGIEEADELTDGHLASVASVLLSLRSVEFVAPGSAAPRMNMPGLKSHDYQQSLSVALWDADGRLIRRGDLVYGGVQIIRPDRLAAIPDQVFSLNRLWDLMIAEGRAFGLIHGGEWCDVGRPDCIPLAEGLLDA